MKKNTLVTIGGIVGVLILAYYVGRQVRKKKEAQLNADKTTGSSSTGQSPSVATNPIVNVGEQLFGFLTSWNDYVVTTQTNALNVRQNPDTKAKIVATLPKGSTIKAKTSGTKDWLVVSKDGSKPLGYVSASFLKPKTA